MHKQLLQDLLFKYEISDFPATYHQYLEWEKTKPLQGIKILDCSPIFFNTTTKYLALLTAGAELYINPKQNLPSDDKLINVLPKYGIKLATEQDLINGFDIILDCAGLHSHVPTKYGYVELTRSGVYNYDQCQQPVFMVDSSKIKLLETIVGTGDGFVRGMQHFGHQDFTNKKIMVFGGGKVGRGIAKASLRNGAKEIVIIDLPNNTKAKKIGKVIDFHNIQDIIQELSTTWCIVTATGIKDALKGIINIEIVNKHNIILANMGVHDEFGEDIPEERVLFNKKTLNFSLKEPTQLKYIDPSLALHNQGALLLLNGELKPGINDPTAEIEETILSTLTNGKIANEINYLED